MPKPAAPTRKRAAGHGAREGAGPQARQKRPRPHGSADAPAVGVLQPKLRVSEPNDRFEREADHVADRVMRAPAPATPAGTAVMRDRADDEQKLSVQREKTEKDEDLKAQTFSLQREEATEEEQAQTSPLQREKTEEEEEPVQTSALQRAEEEEETPATPPVQRQEAETEPTEEEAQTSSLQRKQGDEEEQMQQRAGRPRRPEITPDFEADLKLLRRGGGQPLPDSLRAFLEPRFGRSLADVRVHAGREAAELAREANARAFTVGKHLVFGAGEYRPGVEQGQRLIAHELTHVFHQRGGLHSVQREVGPDRAAPAPAQPELPTIEELRAAFQLDSAAAPPSVRTVALAMVRTALLKRSDAERLKPLTESGGEVASLVRRIVSGGYTLELAAMRGGGGVERGWKLTNHDKRQTFVSNPGGRQLPAGASARGNTITLTSPLVPGQLAKGTIAAGVEVARRGEPPPKKKKPAPLVPETVPAGTVPKKGPAVPKSRTRAEGAPATRAPRPAAERAAAPTTPPALAPQAEELEATGALPATPEKPSEAEGSEPAEGGEPAAEPEHAPNDPQEDPEFQLTLEQIAQSRRVQGKQEPPTDKLEETEASAVIPKERQQARNDRDQHLEKIDSTAKESGKASASFTPEAFKELLKKSIKEHIQLPADKEAADRFKKEKPIEKAKQEIRGKVEEQNKQIAGPLATEVQPEQPPPHSESPLTEPAELVKEAVGGPPRPINPAAAAPKPRLDSEISMEAESRSLDDLMAENKLTEEQLAESNEPTFVRALDSKKEAQQKAAEVPGRFREEEQNILGGAQQKAAGSGASKLGGMFQARKGSFGTVFSTQGTTSRDDKLKQDAFVAELMTIYQNTKKDVDFILDNLSSMVDVIFTVQMDVAKQIFESSVESRLDDIYGFFKFDDWLFGEDTEAINEVFESEKKRFMDTLDRVIDQVAELIASQLNAAIRRIEKGRADAKEAFGKLDKEQQRLAEDAFNTFSDQFTALEEAVLDKQRELADTLAEAYQSNVDSLRESFDKIKSEVSKGWIQSAVEFIADVATAIYRLGQLLLSLLSRIANVIGDILAHPIRFLENLAKGVGDGFDMFSEKIDEYLLAAFFDWIRGSVGGAGITLPEKFDAAGIFDLVAQVLGLSWQTFKEIAARVWGKASVEFLEQGAAAAEKGLEIFYIVREKGLGGLWDYIVDRVSSLVDEVIEKAKETVFYETIKRAIIWIAGLFNPVGAFIKAAQAIYAALRFLVDNIDRIEKLVDAFMSSIELAVAGNTAAISQRIVEGLRLAVVMAIDFLAKLLGLGNLAEKVRKILKAIRKPVERAIEAVLKKLRPFVHGLLRKLGVKGVEPKTKEPAGAKAAKPTETGKPGEPAEDTSPLSPAKARKLIIGEMKRPAKSQDPAQAIAETNALAEALKAKYQPRLTKGTIKITVLDKVAEGVAEDGDIDIDVALSPGTRVARSVAVPLEQKFGKQITACHPDAREPVRASVTTLGTTNPGIRKWERVKDEIASISPAGTIIQKPVVASHAFGQAMEPLVVGGIQRVDPHATEGQIARVKGLIDSGTGDYAKANLLVKAAIFNARASGARITSAVEDAYREETRGRELERPALRVDTIKAIIAAAPKTSSGDFIDPNPPLLIIPKAGPYHFGHKTGHEHRRLVKEAQARGMTQGQFNDWVNDHPEWFQIEDPARNVSHEFEEQ